MRFVLPFTEQDILRASNVPITANLVAKATFEGVRAAFNYWVFRLRPVLQGLVNPTNRERSFLGLRYRAIGYVASIRKFNHAMHVQSIAASARSLFELGVDITPFTATELMTQSSASKLLLVWNGTEWLRNWLNITLIDRYPEISI